MESTLSLCFEDGFDATTVQQIAEHAGVSRRTFFRYFPTKEAAFFVGHRRRLSVFRELVAVPLPDEPPMYTVRRALLAVAAMYVADRQQQLDMHRVIRGSRHLMAADLQLDAEWERQIALTLRGAADAPAANAAIAAGAVMGVTRAVLDEWFASDGTTDLIARGIEAFDMLEKGFRSLASR